MGGIAPGDRCPAAAERGAERSGEDALVNAACVRAVEVQKGRGSALSSVVCSAAGVPGVCVLRHAIICRI